jgi:hypothetical protein
MILDLRILTKLRQYIFRNEKPMDLDALGPFFYKSLALTLNHGKPYSILRGHLIGQSHRYGIDST